MITGVLTMLVGESIFLGSRVIALWAATFFVINNIYFLLSRSRAWKGDSERLIWNTKRPSAIWLPRVTPWKPA